MKREKHTGRGKFPIAHLEPAIGGEPLGEDENTPHDPRGSITVTSYRNRDHDIDAPSAKAVIDGLVARKILKSDKAKDYKEIKYISIIQRDLAEKTIITINYD